MKIILSYITKFIQSISFFLLTLSLILLLTIFNESYILELLENNNYLSSTNSKIVKIINKNNIFIDIYYIQNYLLSIKYRLRDKVIKRRVV